MEPHRKQSGSPAFKQNSVHEGDIDVTERENNEFKMNNGRNNKGETALEDRESNRKNWVYEREEGER